MPLSGRRLDCTPPLLRPVAEAAGRVHHVVISRKIKDTDKRQFVHLGVHNTYDELDDLIERFKVNVCVIDGMPDIHATRSFARRHHWHVYMNFFNEHQRGATNWDTKEMTVQVNRTEALDHSQRIIRDGKRVLPRRSRLVEEFARHLAADAKQLHEDEQTGAQEYRYVKTGRTTTRWLSPTTAWQLSGRSGARGHTWSSSSTPTLRTATGYPSTSTG